MLSPRPSWVSLPVSRMVSPPSWRMATSKETRVRVDGRRRETEHVLARRDGQELAPTQRLDDVADRQPATETEQEPVAAQFRDHVRVTIEQAGELLLQEQRLALDLVQEPGGEHDVEHGIADRHGERIAAEGRTVGAGRHALGGLDVAQGQLVEALGLGAEAFEIFLLPAGRERRQRPAVERALEGDDPVA